MTGFAIRELGDDDHDLEAFVRTVSRLDPRIWGLEVSDLRRWSDMVGPELRTVAEVDGVIAAVASISGMPYDPTSVLGVGLVVDPQQQGIGIGSALFERLHAWALDHRARPRISVSVTESDERTMAWWARRGFAERERYVVVEAPIDELDLDSPPASPGVSVTSLEERDDLRRAAYDAQAEFRHDMPGEEFPGLPYEQWIDLVDSGVRPASSVLLALDAADRVVGISTLSVAAHDSVRAQVGFLGVDRAARGTGIATALKHRQLQWCRDAGYRILRTVNHDDNAAMRAINARAGFRVTSVQVQLERTEPVG